MTSSKIALGSIFILGVVFGLLLSNFFTVNVAMAATVASSTLPSSIQEVNFASTSPSLARYVFRNYLPTGISFNKLKIAMQDISNDTIYVGLYNDNGTSIGSCNNATCVGDDFARQEFNSKTFDGYQNNTNTYSLGTTSLVTIAGDYLIVTFDPNTPYKFYRYFGALGVFSETGANDTRSVNNGIAWQLCSAGSCDFEDFDISNVGETINGDNFILITEPDYGTTTATTSVDLAAFFQYNGTVATTTRAEISVYNAVTNQLLHNTFVIVPAYNDISFNLPVTFQMATGSKIMTARYVTALNNIDLLTPKSTFFNVITNSYLAATGLETPNSDPFELTQIDCDTFDVGCQFQKALVFLFVPPQTTLDKFNGLWQELKTLKPFGYVTVTIEQLKDISSSGAGAYTMPTIPFLSAIFDPLKTGISLLLWGIFAFVFYNRRLKNIDI